VTKTTESLNEIFDVPAVTAEMAVLLSPNEPVSANAEMVVYSETPASTDKAQDQTDDFNLARTTIRDLIGKAKETLEGIMDVASESETPRSYEVAATLIKTISDVTKDLLELHKKMGDIGPKDAAPPGATNFIDKAVFVGSPSDLLDRVKYDTASGEPSFGSK
jgi:hypothetical protein